MPEWVTGHSGYSEHIFMKPGFRVIKEMNSFAPGYIVLKSQWCAWIFSFITMVFRQVGVGWAAMRQWRRWGKWWRGPDTCSQPAAGAAERRWGRRKCKKKQNTWHLEIQMSSSVWQSVRDSILSVHAFKIMWMCVFSARVCEPPDGTWCRSRATQPCMYTYTSVEFKFTSYKIIGKSNIYKGIVKHTV